ncbi:MAG: ATP synthase F1 subunit epsilon [Bacteroidota bacterium]|nr:ATP synthase F1 subunit epsilon [Bacteroidota bacterium]MDP4230782.1 ATP synthase F1 subunit epsilon [Bacteroidota bacterium]MDP4236175.1 ATP synthase F1 subunit epsilon [Bacteroidota bacterium]
MSKTIKLKIVTPTQTVFEGEVENFTAPGAVGTFQVLFNHAPIVAKLAPGMFKYVLASGAEEHYYVSGGFLELHQNSGTVLADTAERPNQINIADVERQIADLRQRYADHALGMTNDQYHAELDAANARLSVARQG